MPFLNRIQRWADERPHDTAVVVDGRRIRWAELRGSAATLVADAEAITVLCEPNSTKFAVQFAAAVAGGRQCAVLDPAWPVQLQEEIVQRVHASAPPIKATPDVDLVDGPPESAFLIWTDLRHHLGAEGLYPVAEVLAAVLRGLHGILWPSSGRRDSGARSAGS